MRPVRAWWPRALRGSTLALVALVGGAALPARAAPPAAGPAPTPVWGLPGRAPAGLTWRPPPVAARSRPLQLSDACAAGSWAQVEATSGGGRPVWSLATSVAHDVALAGAPAAVAGEATLHRGRPISRLAWAGVGGGTLGGVSIAAAAHSRGPLDEVWVASVGLGGAAYRSTDGGETFLRDVAVGELNDAAAMVLAPAADGVVAAVTRPGPDMPLVLRWAGGWQPYGDLADLNTSGRRLLWDVAVGLDGRGWLAPDGRGLWRLDDAASRWLPVGDISLTTSTVMDVVLDARNPLRLMVALGPSEANPDGAYERGVRTSVDGGDTWSPTALKDVDIVTALALTASDQVVFAGSWGEGLWRSADGGGTWRMVPGPGTGFIRHLASVVPGGRAPTECELLFAGTETGLFVRNMARARDYSVALPLVMDGASRGELGDWRSNGSQ